MQDRPLKIEINDEIQSQLRVKMLMAIQNQGMDYVLNTCSAFCLSRRNFYTQPTFASGFYDFTIVKNKNKISPEEAKDRLEECGLYDFIAKNKISPENLKNRLAQLGYKIGVTSEFQNIDPQTQNDYQRYCYDLVPIDQNNYYPFECDDQKKKSYIKEEQFKNKRQLFFQDTKLLAKNNINQMIDILKNNFIVGEYNSHSQTSTKEFLIQNMELLKQAGFEILFMEHLFYEDQQLLDDFFKTGNMDAKLKGYLASGFGYGSNFLELVEAAQKNGIRIVAVDTEATYHAQYDETHRDFYCGHALDTTKDDFRISSMNYTAWHIMMKESKNNTIKWFGLMGSAHINQYQGVPGVAELMGSNTVIIYDYDNGYDYNYVTKDQDIILKLNCEYAPEMGKVEILVKVPMDAKESLQLKNLQAIEKQQDVQNGMTAQNAKVQTDDSAPTPTTILNTLKMR